MTLCGKSLDLVWLSQQGHNVVGVEISNLAAEQLFEENGIAYSVAGTIRIMILFQQILEHKMISILLHLKYKDLSGNLLPMCK